MYLLIVLLAVNPLYLAAGAVPIGAFNASQLGRTSPSKYSSGEALEQLGMALNKRIDDISPGRKLNGIQLVENTPTEGGFAGFKKAFTKGSEYANNSRIANKPGEYGVTINPNVDRAYLAHELGHIASDQTDIGRMIRSAGQNPKLTRALAVAGLVGAGSTAALTEGDDDLGTSVALAYASSLPTIADEFLASKNGLAIMDTAGMRASMGQRGRLAAGMLSYLGAPLLLGATANFAGNLVDDDQQTSGTAVMN